MAFVNRGGFRLLNSFSYANPTEGVRLNKAAISPTPTGIVRHIFSPALSRFVQEYGVCFERPTDLNRTQC